jgi:hypothetical protein
VTAGIFAELETESRLAKLAELPPDHLEKLVALADLPKDRLDRLLSFAALPAEQVANLTALARAIGTDELEDLAQLIMTKRWIRTGIIFVSALSGLFAAAWELIHNVDHPK